MAIRNARHITKNSDIVNRPLPTDLLKGEAIVNTADGIVWYSGVTTSTNEWTPAGTGSTANYFEVGSNLYDLRLRNQLTEYQGTSGAGLSGKFLSGTTGGFVLANISDIADSTDSYVTGGTFNDLTDEITLTLNQGRPDVVITGITSAVATGVTWTPNLLTIGSSDGSSVSTLIDEFSGLTISGDFNVSGDTNVNDITASTIDASTIFSGGTDLITIINSSDNYTTGSTLIGSTAYFDTIDSLSAYTLDLSTLDTNDTFTTGLTYSNSLLTISRNEGLPDLTTVIDSVSGLTVTDLTDGRVVYVGTGGKLVDAVGFTYDDTTNTFSVPSDGTVNVGTGGLNVDGDTIIQGSLTVFGPSISAFTSDLYVEDPNVVLNFNPSATTVATSIGAGFTIQDGNGITSGDVVLQVNRLDTLTGLTSSNIPDVTEYSSSTGYENRGWVTQLNDIVIRSSAITTPNGVRVLAEFDILDGGEY